MLDLRVEKEGGGLRNGSISTEELLQRDKIRRFREQEALDQPIFIDGQGPKLTDNYQIRYSKTEIKPQ